MKNKPYPLYQFDQAENIWALLELAADKYGEKDAYVYKQGKQLLRKSFVTFRDESHALAAYFIGEGMRGQKIAILSENSYEWIVSWFGIVLSGNIAVPVDRLLQPEQIAFILGDTQAAAIVHSEQYKNMLEPDSAIIKIHTKNDLPARIAQGAARLKAEGKTTVPDDTDKDEIALIIYTSGTTGIAKGVALTQDNLCFDMNSLTQFATFPGHNLFVLPLNHVYAFQGVLIFLAEGLTTYISAGLKRLSQELKDYGPHTMCVVPLFLESMHGKVMANARKEGIEKKLRMLMKLSLGLYNIGIDVRRKLFGRVLEAFGGNLSTVFCGGAAIDPDYVRDFRAFGVTVIVGYGITECSPVISGNRNNYHRDGTVGRPIPGAEFKTDAPDGKSEGELYVRGRMVMRAYYNNEAATREAFDGDWFKTGDVGVIDDEGVITITGRKKNIIILSNGKNLYPEELELLLMKQLAVKEVVVREADKQVAAEIYPDSGWLEENGITDAQAHLEAAVEAINQTLPPYKNITKIILRDTEFPKTSSQKIRRNIA